MNTQTSGTLADKLAEAALTILVRTCRKEVAVARKDELEIALTAMRERAKPVLDQLLDDARQAPWIAEMAFHAAALDLAQAGIATLRGR
jgi:hypothetical protein